MTKFRQNNIVSRIAPTPSGLLHVGNAFSFVLTWLLVRKAGGKLLLRIDDIDSVRKKPEFVEDIFRTIDWLDLDYDLGPQGPDEFEKKFSQKHRHELYFSVLDELEMLSGLLYKCSCSRKEIQQQSPRGIYPNTCRNKNNSAQEKKCALRIKMPETTEVSWFELSEDQQISIPAGRVVGDFVVKRKDGIPAYQLVSLADDMDYGVNLVVRGKDLEQSTAAQLFLASCLTSQESGRYSRSAGSFQNAGFLHHPLILNSAGEKLSKSRGASSVAEMIKAGGGPQEIFTEVALYLKLPQDIYPNPQALLRAFSSV